MTDWKNRYTPEPGYNPNAPISRDDVSSMILSTLRDSSAYGSYAYGSIPQLAVRMGVVSNLPTAPQVNQEAYLEVDSTTHAIAHMLYLSSGWVQIGNPPLVTSLPTSVAVEGMQVYYDTGTAGVRWHLIYDSSDGTTYPWMFVGGPPLWTEVTTSEGTASASYTDLTTAGPSLTNPLAGDYLVNIGADSSGTSATAISYMAVKRGASATADSDGWRAQPAGTNYLGAGQGSRLMKFTSLSASTTLKCQYKVSAGTANYSNRWITATPVRVG